MMSGFENSVIITAVHMLQIQVSLYRYLTRSRSSLMSAGGMKDGFTIPHM